MEDKIVVIKINEDGEVNLKEVDKINVNVYPAFRSRQKEFVCKYCKRDPITSLMSISSNKWVGSYPFEATYTYIFCDSHKKRCKCPTNPLHFLFNPGYDAGYSKRRDFRGNILIVKYVGPDDNRVMTDCDQQDLSSFVYACNTQFDNSISGWILDYIKYYYYVFRVLLNI